MSRFSRSALVFLLALIASGPATAQSDGPAASPALSHFSLDNGLEVFIVENRATPLVRVELSFRAGAMAQGAADAGIFTLHELTLAQGCEKFRGPAEMAAARLAMGASETESSVGLESVSFRSLQPASKLPAALDYWASALTKPLFEAAALEAAKKTLAARQSPAPDPVLRLFSSYPWRKDAFGSPAAIAALGREALLKLHAAWFLPNNAALFIVGNVKADRALELAKAAFGGWARGPDPWAKPLPAFPLPGVRRPTFVLKQDPALSDGTADVSLFYRGPDLAGDPKARTTAPAMAAAAEIWTEILNEPGGAWTAKLSASIRGFRSQRAAFAPGRDGSLISLGVRVSMQKGEAAWKTAMIGVKEQVRGFEMEALRKAAQAYLGAGALEAAKARLADADTMASNNIASWTASLGRAWASGGTPWITGRAEKRAAVTWKDIEAFTDAWIAKNLEVVVLSLSPADYGAESAAAKANGFELADMDAPWWAKR